MTAPLDLGPTFWDLVSRRADLTPDRVFLEDDKGGRLSFAQYRDAAERAAAGLLDAGVQPRRTVSWQLPTTLAAAVLAGALARLTVVQNPIIHILRRAEVGFIVEQLRSDWLVTPGVWRGFDFAAMAQEVADAAPMPLSLLVVADALPEGDPATLAPFAELRAAVGDDATDWVLYSSGSTGRPKGARHSDRSLMAGASGFVANMALQADDVFPMAYPITHIGGIVFIVAELRVGGRLVLLDSFDPVSSPGVMAAHGATILGSALPFFTAYRAAQRAHGPEPLFPRLRFCSAGGAPIPPELHGEIKQELGGLGVLNGWGLTEFPLASFSCVGDPDDWHALTVGRCAPGVAVRVVAPDGTEQPVGGEGELRLTGPQMLQGYVDAELNADGFDEQGWFRTGDLGFVDGNGNIHVTGRLKDIIIRNAENISAVEVENVLYSHPAIADVAVVGLPDPRTGERACAVVQLAAGHTALSLASIAEHCREHGLASQKIPEQLEIVAALPRHPQGKILKHEIRARLLAGLSP